MVDDNQMIVRARAILTESPTLASARRYRRLPAARSGGRTRRSSALAYNAHDRSHAADPHRDHRRRDRGPARGHAGAARYETRRRCADRHGPARRRHRGCRSRRHQGPDRSVAGHPAAAPDRLRRAGDSLSAQNVSPDTMASIQKGVQEAHAEHRSGPRRDPRRQRIEHRHVPLRRVHRVLRAVLHSQGLRRAFRVGGLASRSPERPSASASSTTGPTRFAATSRVRRSWRR